MQCPLPHEASTNCPAGTEPWASIQLRRRRPYAVEGLATSSQSPCSFVGENFPIASQLWVRSPSPGILPRCPESRFYGDLAAEWCSGSFRCLQPLFSTFVTT